MSGRTILLGLNITLAVVCTAQEYVPFPTGNAHWNVLIVATCDDSHPPDTILARYVIHGDTIFQEVDYMRLCLEKGDTVNPVIEPVGGLRKEEKKIYFIGRGFGGADPGLEFLLYDFNARVGDTVRHLQEDHPTFFSVIKEIDSMQIGVDYRKRYLVDHNWYFHNPDYIVEGIGSILNGLLGHISDIPTCGGSFYWEHVCFKDQNVEYVNPRFGLCYPDRFFVGIERSALPGTQMKLYPNPCGDILNFDFTPQSDGSGSVVRIYDMAGKLVLEEKIKSTSLEISQLSSGVYVLDIETGSRNQKFRFIKAK